MVKSNKSKLLEKAKESCLLAVDVYNKPMTSFRSGAYIVLMMIAWTSLFHAIFEKRKLNYYYKKEKGSRYYKIIDGERAAWDVSKCAKEYFKTKDKTYDSIRFNLEFFIGLRNKIEHRFMPDLDDLMFGEAQALLHNFEYILNEEFGEDHSININLLFSLQFANAYPKPEKTAIPYSKDFLRIKDYITDFRNELSDEIYSDQRYSFKAYLLPRLSNNENRAECAIEWVPYDPSNPEEMAKYQHVVSFIKEKVTPVANLDYIRAKEVADQVKKELMKIYGSKIKFAASHHYHCAMYYNVRPENGSKHKTKTKKEFCVYDQFHDDYMYTKAWVSFLIRKLSNEKELLNLFPSQRSIVFGLISSSEVIKEVKTGLKKYYGHQIKFTNHDHLKCCEHFNIRPTKGKEPKEDINEKYCSYEGNNKYLYTSEWAEFLIEKLKNKTEFELLFSSIEG